jgi:hypothetical protein
MSTRWAFLFAVALGAASLSCGADANDSSTRANNPNGANNPGGIGPTGGVGPSPRDMPGRGRGSEGPHGR